MYHILLIEDNKDVRENIAEILELAGYKVSTSVDGKKGVEQVNKEKPDLIIIRYHYNTFCSMLEEFFKHESFLLSIHYRNIF